MPNTEIPFISAMLIGREGILPPAKPMMRNFPPHFIHFKALLKNSPPTGSYIISTPLPNVISKILLLRLL